MSVRRYPADDDRLAHALFLDQHQSPWSKLNEGSLDCKRDLRSPPRAYPGAPSRDTAALLSWLFVADIPPESRANRTLLPVFRSESVGGRRRVIDELPTIHPEPRGAHGSSSSLE
jgi:hypothetical protein